MCVCGEGGGVRRPSAKRLRYARYVLIVQLNRNVDICKSAYTVLTWKGWTDSTLCPGCVSSVARLELITALLSLIKCEVLVPRITGDLVGFITERDEG
ncbi:hypothetical protein RRG08_018242 [Elysia crispata]|uniref:Uncharacterized protein n=1 Tax=Elysia crispata TaxID=231223 RepID=A0AAE1AU40_9GAST|nr:hypothetical protein RRG08_018242 [Elysia crispata]